MTIRNVVETALPVMHDPVAPGPETSTFVIEAGAQNFSLQWRRCPKILARRAMGITRRKRSIDVYRQVRGEEYAGLKSIDNSPWPLSAFS